MRIFFAACFNCCQLYIRAIAENKKSPDKGSFYYDHLKLFGGIGFFKQHHIAA